jgi:hypothetical protein
MSVTMSVWDQIEQLGITTRGPKLYPFHACYDFEARIVPDNETKFEKLPPNDFELPPADPITPAVPTPHYNRIMTRYEEDGTFTIRNPDPGYLDDYCYTIAQRQPCIFDLQVDVLWQYHNNTDKPRRTNIITPGNVIHGLADYQELYPAGHIIATMRGSNLFRPNIRIMAIVFKVHRKQTMYPSELKPISYAINSNIPGHNEPRFEVCQNDEEDSIERLIETFIAQLNEMSDTAYDVLHQQHLEAFELLK